jgi:MFS family permease
VTLDDALARAITALVYGFVAGLFAAIMVANTYAFLHAWRTRRTGWALMIGARFLTGVGGGLPTAVYLVLHHGEPMPRRAWWKRRAPAFPVTSRR